MQGRQELTNRRVGSVHRVRLTRLAPQSTSAAAPVLQTHRGEGQGTCTTGRHRPRTACTSGRGTTSAPMDAMRRCRSPVGDRSAADGMVLNGGAAGTGAGNVMNASSRYLVTCCPSPCRDTRAAVVLMSDGPLPRISVGPSRPTGPAPTATHLTGVWRGRATATCRSGHGSVSRVGEGHSELAEPTGWSAISRVARPSTTDCSVPTRAAGATSRPAGAVIRGREAAGK